MTDPKHYLLRMTHKEYGEVSYVGVGEFPGTDRSGWCLAARTDAQAFYSPKEAKSVLRDPGRWAHHTKIENYHAKVVGVTIRIKKKPINFDLIDVAYIETLIASGADGLAMDDEKDREAMATFLMSSLICPMRERLTELGKSPAVSGYPSPGCVHLDDVLRWLFGE